MNTPIEIEWIALALQEGDSMIENFLDLQTGEILRFSEMYGDPEEMEEEREAMDSDPDRFEYIEPIGSNHGWRLMQDFIDSLASDELADSLTRAIHGQRPFRRFKDRLSDHPDVLKQWYDFEERHYLNLAEDWLDSRGLLQRAKYSPASKALKNHAPEAD